MSGFPTVGKTDLNCRMHKMGVNYPMMVAIKTFTSSLIRTKEVLGKSGTMYNERLHLVHLGYEARVAQCKIAEIAHYKIPEAHIAHFVLEVKFVSTGYPSCDEACHEDQYAMSNAFMKYIDLIRNNFKNILITRIVRNAQEDAGLYLFKFDFLKGVPK